MRRSVLLIALLFTASAVAKAAEPTTRPNFSKPPAGAIVLFDGSDISPWQTEDGRPCPWHVVDGALEVTPGTGDIYTRDGFEDCRLHIEFRTPEPSPGDEGQHRGNSGIFMQKLYEVQVLESYGLPPSRWDCAAIFSIKAPDKNMALPPRQWQSYDITYRSPRWDSSGKKTENARITVVWNGQKVHDDVEIPHCTRDKTLPEPPGAGPIELQDHTFKVQYRNIWIVPLKHL